eukprot:10798752-Alexandrium_andersonii.AAC.1
MCNAVVPKGHIFTLPDALPPVGDMTVYELMQCLLRDGWEWRLLPRAGRLRKALSFRPGDAGSMRVFCTRADGKAHRFYLQCLVGADLLQQRGVEVVEHGHPEVYYKGLLGIADPPIPAQQQQPTAPALEADE